jgi:hypothetical protein
MLGGLREPDNPVGAEERQRGGEPPPRRLLRSLRI